MLVFHYIDILLPDQLVSFHVRSGDVIRWPLASIVILFPVYVWVSWTLAKDAARYPEKRQFKIRKWLLSFTLFLASAVIVGDLIALLYNFLGGELSARFLLKVAAVFFIAVAVFGYYLWNLRAETMASRDPRMRMLVFGAIAAVVGVVIVGFVVAGSPFQERLRRFDERRAQDLQQIQWQIVNYWQRKERLPETFENLRDDISGYAVPSDPEDGSAYGYSIRGDVRFELCANFKTASEETDRGAPKPAFPDGRDLETWRHGIGKVCFKRTIDPELYPPFEKSKEPLRPR